MALSALRGHYLQETCLLGGDVIQRDVHVVSVLAHNHGMPLTECTSSNVLSTDADIKTCSENSLKFKGNPRNSQTGNESFLLTAKNTRQNVTDLGRGASRKRGPLLSTSLVWFPLPVSAAGPEFTKAK